MSGWKILSRLGQLSTHERNKIIEVYLMQKLKAMNAIKRGDNKLVVAEVDERLKEIGATGGDILSVLYNIRKMHEIERGKCLYEPALSEEIKRYSKK